MSRLFAKLSLKANPDYNISARYSAAGEGSVELKVGACPRKQYEAAKTKAHLLATKAQNEAIVDLGTSIGSGLLKLGRNALSFGKSAWGVVKSIPSRINQARVKAHLLCGADKGTAVYFENKVVDDKEASNEDLSKDTTRGQVTLLRTTKEGEEKHEESSALTDYHKTRWAETYHTRSPKILTESQ